jgi:hypothetical protein
VEFDAKTLPELEPCGISAIDEAVVEEPLKDNKSPTINEKMGD